MKLVSIDERCSGCRACLLTCAIENQGQINPGLAALGVEAQFPSPGVFKLHLCDQCGACAEACPEGAIEEKNGVYLIDEAKCTNCLECVEACPQGVMYTHPLLPTPIKCTLCGQCVVVCPRDALAMEKGA